MPQPDNSWDWYYNSHTGIVTQMTGGAAALIVHTGTGWHGPFRNHDAAITFYQDGKIANPGWKPPVSDMNIIGQAENVISSIGDAASSAGNAASQLPGELNKLGNQIQNAATDPFGLKAKIGDLEVWFVRIGEVLLGLLLIGVGVAGLTGKGNIVTKTVGVAGKAVKLVK